MIPLLERWPTKAKEASSPHEVRLTLLDTNPVFQCLWENASLPPYCCFESNKLQNFNLLEERFIEDISVTQ